MTDLITLKKGEPLTNTKVISDILEVPHRNLLRTVNDLVKKQCSHESSKYSQKFIESSFTNRMGKTYKMYELNEPAFVKLVMQLGNYEKASLVQDQFIQAFFEMKQALLRQSNSEWKKTREMGKQARLDCTDTIKDFIEYAKLQGAGDNAKYYYAHLTKAEYKALKLLQHEKPKTRDLLDDMELTHIIVAENMLKRLISKEMEQKEHYKVIYQKCKDALEKFSLSIAFK